MFIGEQLWLYPIQFSLFPLLTSPFVAKQFYNISTTVIF